MLSPYYMTNEDQNNWIDFNVVMFTIIMILIRMCTCSLELYYFLKLLSWLKKNQLQVQTQVNIVVKN
jgi:hypothetical protein